MKKFKISPAAIIAVIVAVLASSFTIPVIKAHPKTDYTWFTYMSNSQALADLQNNENYAYDDGSQACSGDDNVCGIKANGVASLGEHPSSFSGILLGKIEDVFNRSTTYPSEIAQEPQ